MLEEPEKDVVGEHGIAGQAQVVSEQEEYLVPGDGRAQRGLPLSALSLVGQGARSQYRSVPWAESRNPEFSGTGVDANGLGSRLRVSGDGGGGLALADRGLPPAAGLGSNSFEDDRWR